MAKKKSKAKTASKKAKKSTSKKVARELAKKPAKMPAKKPVLRKPVANESGLGTVVAPVSAPATPSVPVPVAHHRDGVAMARKLLQSLPTKAHARWVTTLTATPRFDEDAAKHAWSKESSADRETAWKMLRDFSFVQPLLEYPGWSTLNDKMGDALRVMLADDVELNKKVHEQWNRYWKKRSQEHTDEYAELAWYHAYCLDPEQAADEWAYLASALAEQMQMQQHYRIIRWWKLTRIEQSVNEPQEAFARCRLAEVLANATVGDRDANLQRAIEGYTAALRIYTERAFPKNWAMTQYNLANAYSDLPTGCRADNLQRAIDGYTAALRIYTEKDFPQDWAMTQHDVALAYSEMPTGDQAVNLQRAIDGYTAALRFRTERDFPREWADTQNNLASVYRELPSGDRAANLQRAIDGYTAALRVYTEKNSPRGWAMIQNNLAIAYRELPTGDKALNLQQAIKGYTAALRIYTEQQFPENWAGTQYNLANAYRDLPVGDRAANLQRAIDGYMAALRVFTKQDFPQNWASTENALTDIYRELNDYGNHKAIGSFSYPQSEFDVRGFVEGYLKSAQTWDADTSATIYVSIIKSIADIPRPDYTMRDLYKELVVDGLMLFFPMHECVGFSEEVRCIGGSVQKGNKFDIGMSDSYGLLVEVKDGRVTLHPALYNGTSGPLPRIFLQAKCSVVEQAMRQFVRQYERR